MTQPWQICKTAVVKLVLERLQGMRIVSTHSNTPTGKPATNKSRDCGGQSLRNCTVTKIIHLPLSLLFPWSYVPILLELAMSITHIQLWYKWHCQHSTNFWIHCLCEEQPNTSLLRQCIAQNVPPNSHKIMSKATSNKFYRTDM
jgi:hypothetical protein